MPPAEPTFQVSAYTDPVIIRISGRANYLNSAPLSDFFKKLIGQGQRRFLLDFQNCSAMDSTFLGILAGAGLELRKVQPPGTLALCRLNGRGLELVRNLGLHRIMQVEADPAALSFTRDEESLVGTVRTERESARIILQAHENLVQVESGNQARFQDVIAFLRSQHEGP